jgi:hypothetical protein
VAGRLWRRGFGQLDADREVKALKTLTGLRGRERVDLDTLAHATSQLALRLELCISEAEVNPPMPDGECVMAVDALVRRAVGWHAAEVP